MTIQQQIANLQKFANESEASARQYRAKGNINMANWEEGRAEGFTNCATWLQDDVAYEYPIIERQLV